uniref:Uncharacterized protein n=1 Tax=Anopheles funestus TaxID=62324 RepID=A0A4Y0BHG4_ANOFN
MCFYCPEMRFKLQTILSHARGLDTCTIFSSFGRQTHCWCRDTFTIKYLITNM